MRVVNVLLVAAALFLSPVIASAQTGEIIGQVRDASGAVLTGVTVTVSGAALIEGTRETATDESGRFRVPAVAVGTYEVRFTQRGFSPVTRSNVEVSSGLTATLTAEMTVAGPTDAVTVAGESTSVDVTNARVRLVLKGSEIADLPTTRDIGSLLLLLPGLTSNRPICSGGIGSFCYPTVPPFNAHTASNDPEGGLTQGRILVDGMVINGGRVGDALGTANGLTLDPAVAEEVVFTIAGALGESETGGASINIVPRSGGHRYAGTFFNSYLNSHFFSNNRQTRLTSAANVQPYLYDYDVNGSLGGPIVTNRLWFHAYAGDRGVKVYPNGGETFIYPNLNEGKFAANYVPERARGAVAMRNQYTKGNVRLTFQATPRNKFNIYWDEQSSCTDPCYGTTLVMVSPESIWSQQTYPNRLTQLSWTSPLTNRLLFEAGVTYISTHQDSTHHREYPNYRSIPRVCEAGTTVGADEFAPRTPASGGLGFFINNSGNCRTEAILSGSINYPFASRANQAQNDLGAAALINHDVYRSRASASYVIGSHYAKIGFDGVYYAEKMRNVVNDLRLSYHYLTPTTTGAWDAATRTGNCLLAHESDPYACGNMTLYYPDDPRNLTWRRPRPFSFEMNTGVGVLDERVWYGALYVQDQWSLGRFSLSGALRYDHAASRYGASCIGPDVFVPEQWCSEPANGVNYNDLTPRWGAVWDVFGTGRTAVKWNMGKYLQAAALNGLYVDDNAARRSANAMTRGWDDLNGNRIIDCNLSDPSPHTLPGGDTCGTMLDSSSGQPSTAFQTFGRPPSTASVSDAFCGRTERATQVLRDYCAEAGQNVISGWGKRRYEWQFGLGIEHEILRGLTAEVTYNRRTYGNLTASDTILKGCDYFGPRAAVEDYKTCASRYLDYESDLYDFYGFTVPVDPRLPGGGGYFISGLINQKAPGALPAGAGTATLIRDDLSYYWHGIDANFVMQPARGLRVSGGTSTGRSVRDTCFTNIDTPNVKGRDGSPYGGGCHNRDRFQTNVRGTASYVVPWVDVLVGAVYQYRPGVPLTALFQVPIAAVVWDAGSAHRQGSQFNTPTGFSSTQGSGGLLFPGDLYGESLQMWDLRLSKNVRFAGKRLSVGVDVYNLFNVDTALRYEARYQASLLSDGTWAEDNPATAAVEVNPWGTILGIADARRARISIQFEF
jgi:hypothetical protein